MSLSEVLEATQHAIRENPATAAVSFAARHQLVPNTNTLVDVTIRDHKLTVDEPPVLGGADTAANPVEYALAALGSCHAITYQAWAAKLGIQLDSVAVHVDGDVDLHGFFGLDDSTRPGFGDIRVRVDVTGPESSQRYAELKRQVDEHCPVLDLFRHQTPAKTELFVNP
jgi:uncharacterized OsmC-like protein